MVAKTPDIARFKSLLTTESGLVEVITTRANGWPLVSVVNAGVIAHPVTGLEALAFVSLGAAARLTHLRRRPEVSVVVRRAWDWAALDGTVDLIGPNDDHPAVAGHMIPDLVRRIFQAAGGQHDDYQEFDRAMVEDERCAVLITPAAIYGNAGTS